MSRLQAQATYGISNLRKERDQVAQALREYIAIRQAVDDAVSAKEKGVQYFFGVDESGSEENEDLCASEDQSDCEIGQGNAQSSSTAMMVPRITLKISQLDQQRIRKHSWKCAIYAKVVF